MDIFILDKLLRPIDVVDQFVSFIWTERWSEMGDFELVTMSTFSNRMRFVPNTFLSIKESKRVMKVETIEETVDSDKRRILKIKGRDIVSILEQRVAMSRDSELNIRPVWYMTGWSPGELMRKMFFDICVEGTMSALDIIPFIQWGEFYDEGGTLYPPDTIPEPSESINYGQKIESLYSAIKALGDFYDLGFRMYKNPDASMLYFNVYAGNDRTSTQSTLEPVIFSSDMRNLQNTTEYSDITKEYNVVRVIYTYKDESDNDKALGVVVTDPNLALDPNAAGFDRKVKVIVITSLPEEVTNTLDYLEQLGHDELQKSRSIGVFDGEINQYSQYVYERDYYLGDMVEIRSDTGGTAAMRVEEQIIASDSEGTRSYPTLVTKQFNNPGTWLSWKYDVEWTAMGSEEYWSNQ